MNSKDRRKLHIAFQENHSELIEAARNAKIPFKTSHRTLNAQKIIELARTEIGYSHKTSACDVFRSVINIKTYQQPKIIMNPTNPMSPLTDEELIKDCEMALSYFDMSDEVCKRFCELLNRFRRLTQPEQVSGEVVDELFDVVINNIRFSLMSHEKDRLRHAIQTALNKIR